MDNISLAITSAAQRLEKAGIPEARREAASLLRYVIGRPASFLIAHPDYRLTPDESAKFENAVRRRENREPFQLIVGTQEFYGLDFEVAAGVLIPRPETEILVEKAVNILYGLSEPRILEIGVGTGCIIVSVLHSVPAARAIGVDISDKALELAARNAARHGVSERLFLRKTDLFEGISGAFAMIVSNPPYVPAADATSLQPEVIDFDPPKALFGGEDGLEMIRRVLTESPKHIDPGGYLLMEFGFGQETSVKDLLADGNWGEIEILDDLQGIPRTLVARRAP
jgi:release factor glutamine methyltransferase